MIFFYSFLICTFSSYFCLLVVLLLKLREIPYGKAFVIFVIQSILAVIAARVSSRYLNTSYPIFHIFMFIEYLSIGYLFSQILSLKKVVFTFSLVAIIIFSIESIYLNRWFENNNFFNIYFNVTIAIMSLLHFIKLLNRKEQKSKKYLAFLFGIFFIHCSSSVVLSNYETHIRSNTNWTMYFLFSSYNTLQIIQNLIITWVLWNLKKV